MNELIEQLINNGKGANPVELTSSDLETIKALQILKNGTYTDKKGFDYDFGSNIFWDYSKSRAVLILE